MTQTNDLKFPLEMTWNEFISNYEKFSRRGSGPEFRERYRLDAMARLYRFMTTVSPMLKDPEGFFSGMFGTMVVLPRTEDDPVAWWMKLVHLDRWAVLYSDKGHPRFYWCSPDGPDDDSVEIGVLAEYLDETRDVLSNPSLVESIRRHNFDYEWGKFCDSLTEDQKKWIMQNFNIKDACVPGWKGN